MPQGLSTSGARGGPGEGGGGARGRLEGCRGAVHAGGETPGVNTASAEQTHHAHSAVSQPCGTGRACWKGSHLLMKAAGGHRAPPAPQNQPRWPVPPAPQLLRTRQGKASREST